MYTYLLTAILAAALAFGAGWQVQNWRYSNQEKLNAEQKLVDERVSAKTTLRRFDNVVIAESAATARQAVLVRNAAAAGTALSELRAQSAAAVRSADATFAACLAGVHTLRVVFDSCSGELQSISRAADAHVSDITTLSAAWPK